jgi:predicted nucleic acid-binding protein
MWQKPSSSTPGLSDGWLTADLARTPSPVADGRKTYSRPATRVIIPEIADHEVRRELLRARRTASVRELDSLRSWLGYLAITTTIMRRAAELWALARHTGRPTAGDNTIDADMILVAQAESQNDPSTIIATTNVGHLSGFFPAEFWTNIAP